MNFDCGRPEEPSIPISTLLLQTHARQLYSLPLTRFLINSILVPRGRAPFGQHQESRPLARSNNGSPRFTDFPSLCACSESSLTNLIGSGLNLLCLQSHSKPECRWTGPEVAILGADQKERGFWGREWINSWDFHYECTECNWNRACWACQPGLPVHVAFDAILRPHSASSELRSVLPWLQAWSEGILRSVRPSPQGWRKSVVCPWPEKCVVRYCCSSDVFVLDHMKAWSERVGPPWSGFLHL